MKKARYELVNKFVTGDQTIASRNRALRMRGDTFDITDPVDQQWGALYNDSRTPNAYYDYYFAGEDIKVYLAEIEDNDPEFGQLPIHNLAFSVNQEKAPLYGFWSYCVDIETEALTQRGWVNGEDLTEEDTILSMDPKDQRLKWSSIKSIYRNPDYDDKMHFVTNKNMDALVTPGHKFALDTSELKPIDDIRKKDKIVTMGRELLNESEMFTDSFVELMGWFVTEGHIRKDTKAIEIAQSRKINPVYCERIELCLKRLGVEYSSWTRESSEVVKYYIGAKKNPVVNRILELAPNRALSFEFITALSSGQRQLLIDTMIDGDGSRGGLNARQYVQKDIAHIDSFVALCALSGISTHLSVPRNDCYTVTLKNRRINEGYSLDFHGGYRGGRYNPNVHPENPNKHEPTTPYKGLVWCPETEYGTFVCRRNGKVYVTGNTYDSVMRGTRLVNGTFTLISKHPNYMKDLLTKAAHNRAANSPNLRDDYPAPGEWRQDDENIDKYWGKHLDASVVAQGSSEWSIHPPFSLVVIYGVDKTSTELRDVASRYDRFSGDNALMADQNQRLVESFNPDDPSRLIIDGCELSSVSRIYQPGGMLVTEQYEFFGRDVIVPQPQARRGNSVNVTPPRSGGSGGASVNAFR